MKEITAAPAHRRGRQAAAARPRAVRLTTVPAGLIALSLTISACASPAPAPQPAGGSSTSAAGGTAGSLAACPTLRPGQHDPVDGRDCVRALQQALRRNGYPAQPVTGSFLDRTSRTHHVGVLHPDEQ